MSKLLNIAVLDMDCLHNPYWAGGQARVTREVMKRLVQKGHSVTVYSSAYPGSKDYTEDGIAYTHRFLGTRFAVLNNIIYILCLPFLVPWIQADVILENFTAPFSVCFTPLFTSVPVVALTSFFASAQLEKKYRVPLFAIVKRFGLQFYKNIIALTPVQASEIKQISPSTKIEIIENGVEDIFFEQPILEKNYLLYIGRIDFDNKGLDLLLGAYALVKNSIQTKLVIVGAGIAEEEARLHAMVKDLGLADTVEIVGRKEGTERLSYMANSMAFIVPSRYESQSLTSLEALVLKKPMVCFDIPSFAWVPANAALKVVGMTAESLAKAIEKIVADKELRGQLSTEAFKVGSQHRWGDIAARYEKVFLSVAL